MSEPFSALKAQPASSLEFWGNDHPKCPHCGRTVDVNEHEKWALYEEGEHETSCPYCDGEFTVSTRVKYSFSTDEQDPA